MNKQLNLSILTDELLSVKTKKKEFLKQIDQIIPWEEWIELIKPFYYKAERGNKPYEIELMLRLYILQNLYNLSDMATVAEVIDSRSFSEFCYITSSNQVPDGDTLGRFRYLLEQNNLQQQFFGQVVDRLRNQGLLLKKGTIVDSTIISSPSSTKNQSKQRDMEAHQTKKGNNWYFGYKAHIGVDAKNGLVHSVKVSAANVHDVTMVPELLTGEEKEVYGDSGYLGAERREEARKRNKKGQKINYKINKRRSQSREKSARSKGQIKRREREKSSIRSKVEHVFGIIKARFGYRKTRYKGLKKQEAKLNILCSLANLLIAQRRSLSA